LKGKEGCAMLPEEVSRNNQDKRRNIEMKMRIAVNIEKEDGSELTEPTTIEVDIPEIEAFTGPRVFDEVFDHYERGVLEARNRVVEEATEKYLSEVAKKSPVGVRGARRRTP
jgi:uncharacterized protein YehS (DUF1456 family)